MNKVTEILQAARDDPDAAEHLLPLIYDELRRLASRRMGDERINHTLQPTALVHEAYIRLVGEQQADQPQWEGRAHFFAAAAEAMLLGAKSGADPAMIFEVVNSGWGQSFMLGRNAPVMLDRDFDGVRTQIKVFLKDMGLIKELVRELDMPAPGADLAYHMVNQAVEQGLGDLDVGAIVLPLEEQAGHQIRRGS